MAAVTVGAGGGELLLLPGGNRGIGRGDRDRYQHRAVTVSTVEPLMEPDVA